jgi:hypothetical protein
MGSFERGNIPRCALVGLIEKVQTISALFLCRTHGGDRERAKLGSSSEGSLLDRLVTKVGLRKRGDEMSRRRIETSSEDNSISLIAEQGTSNH